MVGATINLRVSPPPVDSVDFFFCLCCYLSSACLSSRCPHANTCLLSALARREILHRHTASWLGELQPENDELSLLAAAAAAGGGGDGSSGSSNSMGNTAAAIAASIAAAAAGAAGADGSGGGGVHMSVPRHLVPGGFTPRLSEPSSILQVCVWVYAFVSVYKGARMYVLQC